jgi:hypothetical protein
LRPDESGAAVKVQYFGDVNDYRKFTLLRLLSDVGGFKISVCWMLTEPDDSKEGGNRKYLEQAAKWCGYDPTLFEVLAKVPASPQLSDLQRIEADGIVPDATFFNESTPDKLSERQAFHTRCMDAFADQLRSRPLGSRLSATRQNAATQGVRGGEGGKAPGGPH